MKQVLAFNLPFGWRLSLARKTKPQPSGSSGDWKPKHLIVATKNDGKGIEVFCLIHDRWEAANGDPSSAATPTGTSRP